MKIIEKLRLFLFPRTVYVSEDTTLKVIDRIENREPVRVLFVKGARESGMYLDEGKRAEPLFYYMRTFKDILSRYDKIHNVLMIGGAGLTFAKVFLEMDQRNSMTVIEKDERCIEIADRFFEIRPCERLDVRVMAGESFISEAIQHRDESTVLYDAIIIDAFDGNKIAKEFLTESMLKMSGALIRPEGLYILNAINEKGGNIAMHTYMTEEFLKKIFSHTRIFQCENEGNCVLVASDREL